MKSRSITTVNIQPYRILAGLLLATISLCIANQAASQSNVASEYYPLDAGNYWTFQFDNRPEGTTDTTTVLPSTVSVDGVPTKVLQYEGGSKEYYTSDETGIRLHQYVASPDPVTRLDPPAVIANGTVNIPEVIFSDGLIVFEGLNINDYDAFYDTISEVLGLETVTVPFGTFEAVKVKFTFTISAFIIPTSQNIDIVTESTYWLVHQLGPVKQHIRRERDFEVELDTTGVLVDTNIEPPIVEEPKVFLPFLPLLLE